MPKDNFDGNLAKPLANDPNLGKSVPANTGLSKSGSKPQMQDVSPNDHITVLASNASRSVPSKKDTLGDTTRPTSVGMPDPNLDYNQGAI